MKEAIWERHANPASVYTRYSGLPLLALAIFSRQWIDFWSLLPIAATIVWIWLNPRVFPKPRSTRNWASKAVLGERVWLNRSAVPIPAGHRRAAFWLVVLNGAATLMTAMGLVLLEPSMTLAGIAGVILAKTWFLDRMVWLFDVMADRNEQYRSWLY